MAEELYTFEAVDGVRMPWNLWPRNKIEAMKCVLPFSVLYTPVKVTQGLEVRPLPQAAPPRPSAAPLLAPPAPC
jgi:hypothetical protein